MKHYLYILIIFSLNAKAQNSKNQNENNLTKLSSKFDKIYMENYNKAVNTNAVSLFDEHGVINAKLYGISFDNIPIYYTNYNAGAALTIGTNELYNNGSLGLDLSGTGMTIGLWEGDAARKTHQSLTNRISQGDFSLFISSNDQTEHATHVAGTLIGSGEFEPNAKGMAYQANIIGYDWDNDLSEMADLASEGLLVSNHSYGIYAFDGTNLQIPISWFGKYNDKARNIDQLLYNAPYYLPIIAAGNDRQLSGFGNNKGGYDMLTGMSTAKNVITVAAVEEVLDYTSSLSVNMSSFSNWGPTDDGRIKPDISAKGVEVFSLSSATDESYQTLQGTSMATPTVTGSLLLLQEHYHNLYNEYMLSSTLRGLVAHSAKEAGFSNGPDYKFGWGLLDVEKAAKIISNNEDSDIIIEGEILNNQEIEFTVLSSENNPITVTLAWTDPEGTVYYSSEDNMIDYNEPLLINDLDLKVTQGGTEYLPWILNPNSPQAGAVTGNNVLDNIEKVNIYTVNPDTYYTINISHKNNLYNDIQAYSLIISGAYLPVEGINYHKNKTFKAYPNPVKDILIIEGVDTISNIAIFNMLGQKVLDVNPNGNNANINMSSLNNGTYFAKVTINGATETMKIIK